MTQQTINGTVYRVGQVLENYTEAAALLDYMIKNFPNFNFYKTDHGPREEYCVKALETKDFPITITALPNPDPVAVKPTPLTREELLGFDKVYFLRPCGKIEWHEWPSAKGGLYALGIPMFRTEAECRLYHELEASND